MHPLAEVEVETREEQCLFAHGTGTCPHLRAGDLTEVIQVPAGWSFAELREAYIVAGQLSFERGEDITAADLLEGVRALRSTSALARRPSDEAGFRPETAACD